MDPWLEVLPSAGKASATSLKSAKLTDELTALYRLYAQLGKVGPEVFLQKFFLLLVHDLPARALVGSHANNWLAPGSFSACRKTS